MPIEALDYFQLSYEVTRILSESADTTTAVQLALDFLGQQLGWDYTAFWVVDDRRNVLTCSKVWRSAEVPEESAFETVSFARTFNMGEGLVGGVWMKNSTAWIEDVNRAKNFARQTVAQMTGLQSGVAFPIATHAGVLGVMEAFSVNPRPEDTQQVRFLQALGGQIGVFLERARVQADLKELDAQFLMLAGKTSDVVLTIDEHSTILFANSALEGLLGYRPEEVVGNSISMLMPERMRSRHHAGISHYVATGKKNIPWDGIALPGLAKDGSEVQLEIAFGEFQRQGKVVFTGFMRRAAAANSSGD